MNTFLQQWGICGLLLTNIYNTHIHIYTEKYNLEYFGRNPVNNAFVFLTLQKFL